MGVKFEFLPRHIESPGAGSVSFSVDCDAVVDYLNFAPPGARIDADHFTYREMIPAILDVLDRLDITATFFCIAERLEDPEAAAVFRDAVGAGHRIGNHTYSHPRVEDLPDAAYRDQIRRAHESIETHLKVTPRGYRAPAYFLTEAGVQELLDLGYSYDSSAYNAPLSRLAIRMLSLVRRMDVKDHAPLHKRIPRQAPSLISDEADRRMIEWPIPVFLGLAFYGTFHCMAPSAVFHAQVARWRLGRSHMHYELHPIEVASLAAADAHPWLPTAGKAGGRLGAWFERRLGILTEGRSVVTLEDISEAHLHSLRQ
jgi:hypothetical protein